MNNLTPDQQTMLATWQQHTYAEFVLKADPRRYSDFRQKPEQE